MKFEKICFQIVFFNYKNGESEKRINSDKNKQKNNKKMRARAAAAPATAAGGTTLPFARGARKFTTYTVDEMFHGSNSAEPVSRSLSLNDWGVDGVVIRLFNFRIRSESD